MLVAAATIFTACKKDSTTASKTTAQKVIGKWSISSLVGVSYSGGVGYPYTLPASSANYIDFRSDGKSYSLLMNQHDTSTYSIINDHTIRLDLDRCDHNGRTGRTGRKSNSWWARGDLNPHILSNTGT